MSSPFIKQTSKEIEWNLSSHDPDVAKSILIPEDNCNNYSYYSKLKWKNLLSVLPFPYTDYLHNWRFSGWDRNTRYF